MVIRDNFLPKVTPFLRTQIPGNVCESHLVAKLLWICVDYKMSTFGGSVVENLGSQHVNDCFDFPIYFEDANSFVERFFLDLILACVNPTRFIFIFSSFVHFFSFVKYLCIFGFLGSWGNFVQNLELFGQQHPRRNDLSKLTIFTPFFKSSALSLFSSMMKLYRWKAHSLSNYFSF